MNRKEFVKTSSILLGSALISDKMVFAHDNSSKITLKKALGFDMIKEELSVIDKFQLAKDLGFDGIEINTPTNINIEELEAAVSKTGISIPSTVNKDHWSKPLSTSDSMQRKEIVQSIGQSIEQTKRLGGDTVLVVPGVVNASMPYEKAYMNSLEAVRELIPYAEKYNVKIGLENVWNNFLISPVEVNNYLDEINHPLVGWYFDIGNVLRYGWPEHWIEALNTRIVKLHAKEFDLKKMNEEGLRKGFDVELGKGDVNWKEVMKQLNNINYRGEWITLEMRGGGRDHLLKLSKQLDEVLAR